MKRFLDARSRRYGYDGWALRVRGATSPLGWSTCTTRSEARELRDELRPELEDLFERTEIVKVRLKVEVVK